MKGSWESRCLEPGHLLLDCDPGSLASNSGEARNPRQTNLPREQRLP